MKPTYGFTKLETRLAAIESRLEKLEKHSLPHIFEKAFSQTEYDPTFGDNTLCICGHSYYRHFDTYDGMHPVGCKYCGCYVFA